jgi:hypothetical protein
LYESVGFHHVRPENPPMPYSRADVFMEIPLEPDSNRSSAGG